MQERRRTEEKVPAAPRTATFAWAGRVVEKRLAWKREERIMATRTECIVKQLK